MSNATFYPEWLGVDKNQFRILSLLAPTGEFKGNLSDMCRNLRISLQTKNRNQLKEDISSLAEGGYITSEQNGRTYSLKSNTKETVIEIPTDWLVRIMNHEYTSEKVSWQAVLKVLLWTYTNSNPKVTRSDIAVDLNIGEDTITSALNVLERDLNAITRKQVIKETENGELRCVGLEIIPTAWWD